MYCHRLLYGLGSMSVIVLPYRHSASYSQCVPIVQSTFHCAIVCLSIVEDKVVVWFLTEHSNLWITSYVLPYSWFNVICMRRRMYSNGRMATCLLTAGNGRSEVHDSFQSRSRYTDDHYTFITDKMVLKKAFSAMCIRDLMTSK